MMFSFSLQVGKGRIGPKMVDKFQPTRYKDATSQKCAWGKGMRHQEEEEGALLPSHIKGLLQLLLHSCLFSGNWRVRVQGRLSAPLCLGQNSEHS